jgi:hypothetical protein
MVTSTVQFITYTPDATATEYEQLVDRCSRNSFEFYTKRVWKIQVVVYNVISRANHSCRPNATLEIQTEGDNKGQARLIATKAISNNSEILVNYISENWTDDSDARKALLNNGWRFDCTCEGCAPEVQASIDAGERASARGLRDNMTTITTGLTPAQIPRGINRDQIYIDTLGILGIWDDKLSEA